MTPERAKELLRGHYDRVVNPTGPPRSIEHRMTVAEIDYLRGVKSEIRSRGGIRADSVTYITALAEVADVDLLGGDY